MAAVPSSSSAQNKSQCSAFRIIQVAGLFAIIASLGLGMALHLSFLTEAEVESAISIALHSVDTRLDDLKKEKNLMKDEKSNETYSRPQSEAPTLSVGTGTTTPGSANHLTDDYHLSDTFRSIINRASRFQRTCDGLDGGNITDEHEATTTNSSSTMLLSPFGIIDSLRSYKPDSDKNDTSHHWNCSMPPSTLCEAERFTIIMMGYGKDRVFDIRKKMRAMFGTSSSFGYGDMIEEFILVWNNRIPLSDMGTAGADIVRLANEPTDPFHPGSHNPNPFRIFNSHEHGLGGSLMNRYHPALRPKSEAILYYDDDGPFYDYWPIRTAFELWKRNSDAQVGAMPRAFTLSTRQQEEKNGLLNLQELQPQDDRKFISHCRDKGDAVKYDYTRFCMFDANMVLPSGTFLHRNYLCYIWHPALADLREFVLKDETHPDDMTVSLLVSQLNGRSPFTYPRRIKNAPARPHRRRRRRRRRLLEEESGDTPTRRRLLWKTEGWGDKRNAAINSLVSYFGSITSGSIGWCYKTSFHKFQRKRNDCFPELAQTVESIPWMNSGQYQNDVCPGGTVK